MIAAGPEHTCTRLWDGTVKCWGRNDHGQLGQGDTVSRGFEVGNVWGMKQGTAKDNSGTQRTVVLWP